jgi:hypothetical protein
MSISGLTHTASAPALLRFAFRVATHAQGWLPAGWLGLYREGVEPSGSLRKVSDHMTILLSCSPDATQIAAGSRMPATAESGHVWTAPGWQVLSSRMQQWSEQPCVRPVSAVHVTAGHNALRGSGPGQLHAFDHAVARVGCPDRRIDRLCIMCCLPSQPFTSREMSRRDFFHAASATGSL